jgi:AcrR family transcriptional regulator
VAPVAAIASDDGDQQAEADWHRRVVARSLRTARERSIERGGALIHAASQLLDRAGGDGFTVQEVADEAGQSLRTLYQYFESKDDLLLAVFEEAMALYATLIADAIAPLTDPLERLAGALIAAGTIPSRTDGQRNRGLALVRLKLAEVEPELIGRSQAPVTGLLGELVEAAADAGHFDVGQAGAGTTEAAVYLLVALNTASITSRTLGNDIGVESPDAIGVAAFCLRGLGAPQERAWLDRIRRRLRLPRRIPQ